MRRRRAERALARLGAASPQSAPMVIAGLDDVRDLVSRLGDWPSRFIESLETPFDVGSSGDDMLDQAVDELAEVRIAMERATVLRPWVMTFRSVARVLDQMHAVATGYLGAIAANVPIDAQRLARDGQSALDLVGATFAEVSELVSRMERLCAATSVADRLQLTARELYAQTGARSVLEVGAAGRSLYAALGGANTGLPALPGLVFGAMDIELSTFMDRDRAVAAGKRVVAALRTAPRPERSLRDPEWLSEFRSASQRLLDAALDYSVMLQAARRDTDALRAVLGLGHALTEGPGRRLLALVLSALGTRPYERLLREDAFAVIKMGEQAGMSEVAAGFHKSLRNAKAHESWEFDGTVLRLSNGIVLDPLEVVDMVLRVGETVMVLECSIATVLLDFGISESLAVPAVDTGFTSEEMLACALEFANLTAESVVLDEDHLRCTAAGEFDKGSMSKVSMLTPWLPQGVRKICLTVRSEDGVHLVEGPAGPLRRFSDSTDELEHGADFVTLCSSWTIDGEPVLSRDHVRKWIAMMAAEALRADLRVGVRKLRLLRDFARDRGLSDMANAVTAAIAVSRSIHLGLPNADAVTNMTPLIEWESRKLPGPFD